jgi:hypothetical protein
MHKIIFILPYIHHSSRPDNRHLSDLLQLYRIHDSRMPLTFVPQPHRATTTMPAIIVGSQVTSQGSAHTQSSTIPTFKKFLKINSRTRIRIRAIIRMLWKANWRRSLDKSSTLRWRLYLRESLLWWVCFLLPSPHSYAFGFWCIAYIHQ